MTYLPEGSWWYRTLMHVHCPTYEYPLGAWELQSGVIRAEVEKKSRHGCHGDVYYCCTKRAKWLCSPLTNMVGLGSVKTLTVLHVLFCLIWTVSVLIFTPARRPFGGSHVELTSHLSLSLSLSLWLRLVI